MTAGYTWAVGGAFVVSLGAGVRAEYLFYGSGTEIEISPVLRLSLGAAFG
jgi:hypothetical protein